MATVQRWFILRAFCLPLANVLFGLQFEEVQCLHFLFYLDGIPAFFQTEFAFLLLARGAGGDGEDAAIHAQIAHLHLVRDAAEGDDGPVLKFSMT
jgi:hypothetical protein